MVANRDEFIRLDLASVDGLLSTLGLADLELGLSVIEAPQVAIGRPGKDPSGEWRTEVETGQLGLNLDLALLDALSLLSVEASLDVEVGGSTARSISVSQTQDQLSALVEADSGIANVDLDALVGLILPVAEITASIPLSSNHRQLAFTQPFAPEHSQSVGVPLSDAFANHEESDFRVSLLGGLIDLSLVEELIRVVLSPLLRDVSRIVLDPLLTGLGLQAGVGEISVNEVRAGSPRLVQ